MVDETARRIAIRHKLDTGELPRQGAQRLLAEFAHGEPCDGCGQSIQTDDVVYRVQLPAEPGPLTLRFHQRCWDIWNRERRVPEPGGQLQ